MIEFVRFLTPLFWCQWVFGANVFWYSVPVLSDIWLMFSPWRYKSRIMKKSSIASIATTLKLVPEGCRLHFYPASFAQFYTAIDT